jgi:membrane-associated phospholipid phosphatase
MRAASRLAEPTLRRGAVSDALRRRWGLIPIWLIGLAVVILIATTLDVLDQGALTSLDHEVSRHVVGWHIDHHRWTRRAIYVLTLFGQRGTVLVLTGPTVLYLAWRARTIDPVLRYVLALLALAVVVYAAKIGLGRTAPPLDLLHTDSGASYPSGHLANAVVTWWLVWWLARGIDPRSIVTRVLDVVRFAGPVCVIIGMTLLDYHWQTDFVGGACVGVILLAGATLPVWGRAATAIDRRWGDARARA